LELLIHKELWEKNYNKVLTMIASKTKSHFYMEILCIEKEWKKLLNKLYDYPYDIFVYGKKMAQHFPKQTYEIYKQVITKDAHMATTRREYRKICRSIKELFEAGGTIEAIELIEEFKHNYKRRPAMLDELSKLRNRLIIKA
jgi:hypothetical protein